MKKTALLSVVFIALMSVVNAQEETTDVKTKNGVSILPSTGDWAVGIDASPFLEYIGNVFTGSFNVAPDFGFTAQHPGAIYIKYYYTNSTVARAAVKLGVTREVEKSRAAIDDDPDKDIYSALDIGITVGVEKRKYTGSRLVGFYGAQLLAFKTPYDMGTRLGSHKYVGAQNSDFDYQEIGGNTITLGAGAFIGAEYFVFPKVSLSGELGLNLTTSFTGIRKNVASNGDETVADDSESALGLGSFASGDLKLLFYF